MMARIRVNGRDTEIAAGTLLAEVLLGFDVTPDTRGVAVAVNDTVVARRQWASHRIENGDVVEIVRAVQGG